jgi:hypothetical protein
VVTKRNFINLASLPNRMSLEYLKGKNALELITEFPKLDWILREDGRFLNTKITTLFFVYYQKKKPRDYEDLYRPVDISQGISLDDLSFIEEKRDESIGLTSRVLLGEPFQQTEYKNAHIPMIDFDIGNRFHHLREPELINLMREQIKDITKVQEGVFLKSGPKNYHFMGLGELLTEDDFITFQALSLLLAHTTQSGKKQHLADPRHVGHSLTPMKYLIEIPANKDKNWSVYDYRDRFSTLRITPKQEHDEPPTVIDVL